MVNNHLKIITYNLAKYYLSFPFALENLFSNITHNLVQMILDLLGMSTGGLGNEWNLTSSVNPHIGLNTVIYCTKQCLSFSFIDFGEAEC